MPSTVLPLATLAAKATMPSALSAGTGCRPSPEIVPPPGAGSPSTVTLVMPLPDARKSPSPPAPRRSEAKNATCPRALRGATIGSDSTLKCSKVPPPGRRLAGGDDGPYGEGLRRERGRRDEAGDKCRDGEDRDHAARV